MQYTESEICRSYRESSKKRSQIGILAELNCVPRDTIRQILIKNNELIRDDRKYSWEIRGRKKFITEMSSLTEEELTAEYSNYVDRVKIIGEMLAGIAVNQ